MANTVIYQVSAANLYGRASTMHACLPSVSLTSSSCLHHAVNITIKGEKNSSDDMLIVNTGNQDDYATIISKFMDWPQSVVAVHYDG
jgi:hypothetical protein